LHWPAKAWFASSAPMPPKTRTGSVPEQLALGLPGLAVSRRAALTSQVAEFMDFGTATSRREVAFEGGSAPGFTNEFWTAKQRQANSLHEISYRACFKPQLPRFFIERLTKPGDVVYDPFMGRGTTPLEAALLGRVPFGNDANPLSITMTRPRLAPPRLAEVQARLAEIDYGQAVEQPAELLAFYHPETLQAICSLRQHLLKRHAAGELDRIDEWIWLVGLNRLTGHSAGFFSVYTLPPNQAVSAKSQIKINQKRNQTPPKRDVPKLILKKSKQLLGDVDDPTRQRLASVAGQAKLITKPAHATPEIRANSVALVVTSPPFLQVVQYAADNWLRCWFVGISPEEVTLTTPQKLDPWRTEMTKVLAELKRVLKRGGHIAFEVGEVQGGKTRLDETVLPCGKEVGLDPVLVLINDQKFTKTANCWGIDNMSKGTNTNRVVVFAKA
jgi:hypothetical protein